MMPLWRIKSKTSPSPIRSTPLGDELQKLRLAWNISQPCRSPGPPAASRSLVPLALFFGHMHLGRFSILKTYRLPFIALFYGHMHLAVFQSSKHTIPLAIYRATPRPTKNKALHPGYGFLSENAAFARQCASAGVTFVGPPPKAIDVMGSKSVAKAIMSDAGVPICPGYHGEDQSGAFLEEEARRVGYPLMIKAVMGGGGKGMRLVRSPEDFRGALEACRREAAAGFADDRVLLERSVGVGRDRRRSNHDGRLLCTATPHLAVEFHPHFLCISSAGCRRFAFCDDHGATQPSTPSPPPSPSPPFPPRTIDT